MLRVVTLFFVLLIVSFSFKLEAQDDHGTKDEQFQEIATMIEDGGFVFEAQLAFPQGGSSVDLTTHTAFMTFSDSTVKARLPFYGRAYQVDYGERGGIRFEGDPQNQEVKKNPGKRKILYTFEVRDNDLYQVTMDVGYSGDVRVSVTSNNRSHISYWGTLSRSARSE